MTRELPLELKRIFSRGGSSRRCKKDFFKRRKTVFPLKKILRKASKDTRVLLSLFEVSAYAFPLSKDFYSPQKAYPVFLNAEKEVS